MRATNLVVLTCALTGCGVEPPDPADDTATVAAKLQSPVAGGAVRATVAVNLRAGPSTAYAVVQVVAAGDTATLLSAAPSGEFFKLDHHGTVGWSHGAYWETVAPGSEVLTVNGWALTADEAGNVRTIAQSVVPHLAGTRADRLRVASRVTWWSLKEGVLGLANPIGYSNCNTASGDRRIGPLETCAPGRAWQVGASAVQVPGRTLADLEAKARALYPGLGVYDVLWRTAVDAGYANGSATLNGIVGSTTDLRRSWLLRNGAIGFTCEEPTVTSECITNAYGWCYGSGWNTTARYAPTRAAALRSMQDLSAIYDRLAP
ncbi:MAG: SH3 domain-containing protein [Archangiaceae bacterium]|nr:SH3 domain-containing protein [Archangiaceae bacterium]